MSTPRVYSMRAKQAAVDPPPPGAVRIDRRTKWGCPFALKQYGGDRAKVLRLYTAWLLDEAQAGLRQAAREELADRHLVCWCHPQACHGDILIAVANRAPLPAERPRAVAPCDQGALF